MARTLVRRGTDDEARGLLAEALVTFGQLGRGVEVVETITRIAEAHVFAQRWTEALDLVDSALDDATGPEYTELRAQLLRLQGQSFAGLGDRDKAYICLSAGLKEARAADLHFEIAATLAARAAAVDDPAQAAADRTEAGAIYTSLGASPPWIALD